MDSDLFFSVAVVLHKVSARSFKFDLFKSELFFSSRIYVLVEKAHQKTFSLAKCDIKTLMGTRGLTAPKKQRRGESGAY